MSNKSMALPYNLPIGSLEAYIHWANRVPLLSAEEEYDCATRCYQSGDLEAARKLVLSHVRFVIRIARGYKGYGLSQADLIQEGTIGLMKAVKRFNPDMGVRLVSFAIYWVKSEIHEFVLRNWRIVKVATTKSQRKLFFNLRKFYNNVCALSAQDILMIAKTLKVSEADVRTMQKRLAANDEVYGHDIEPYDNDAGRPTGLSLPDDRYAPAQLVEQHTYTQHTSSRLQQAIETLDPRSQAVIQARWLQEKKSTLKDLSDELGVSAERIRQIEKNAITDLQLALQDSDMDITSLFG